MKQGMGMINRYQTMDSVHLLIVYPHKKYGSQKFSNTWYSSPKLLLEFHSPPTHLATPSKTSHIHDTQSTVVSDTSSQSATSKNQLMVVLDTSSHSHPQLTVV